MLDTPCEWTQNRCCVQSQTADTVNHEAIVVYSDHINIPLNIYNDVLTCFTYHKTASAIPMNGSFWERPGFFKIVDAYLLEYV